MTVEPRPLVLHVVYRFDTGGLENGVVNLINHMPADAYRHAVLALTEVSEFRLRVQHADVEFIALHKPPGHAFWLYPRLYRLLRQLRPALIHTRNLAAMEVLVPAWAARVPVRVHSEHGREGLDLAGDMRRYQWMRRCYGLFAHQFVALSAELFDYLTARVGIAAERVVKICNGVDTSLFSPAPSRQPLQGGPFNEPGLVVIGTVGRMQAVKNQALLARAFVRALAQRPDLRASMRLLIAGDGPQKAAIAAILADAGLSELGCLAGERRDIADFLRALDVFVLPSLSEGISNTLLEAMASGLAVVATDVGGNAELVEHGRSGILTPSADEAGLAEALIDLADDETKRRAYGQAGRSRALAHFSLLKMVAAYDALYTESLARLAPRSSMKSKRI